MAGVEAHAKKPRELGTRILHADDNCGELLKRAAKPVPLPAMVSNSTCIV